ncbi:MAG: acetylxylan esterase [Kiritimatiellae bacterium]|nr:acetylxylan esterase [Kiritimatiellia bacterium]MDD5520248.1 acetylxylan esterase [Kiritimatiellia bacterium]
MNKLLVLVVCFNLLMCLSIPDLSAADFIYDEGKVPSYTLPDPLLCADGTKVADSAAWKNKRRPELLKIFETEVYGRMQGKPAKMTFEITSTDKNVLGGKAIRKEITAYFLGTKNGPKMNILLYVPNEVKKPVPAFVGLNFEGNHTVAKDPGIKLADRWERGGKEKGMRKMPGEETRGSASVPWSVDMLMAKGYALATVYYGDLEPDFAEGWKWGVRGALAKNGLDTQFAADDGGAIGIWAWGLSRILDYLETDSDIDAKHVAVMGHSRLGKTALWAGATDERFALVISNNSGCGGAALSKRIFGETVGRINTVFPHWFCGNFRKYNENEKDLPVDQHELIALIAPRPVYAASAEEDKWADPRGEFLSAKNAEPVYKLFGLEGLCVDDMPGIDKPVGKTIGYHIRTGKHAVLEYDWEQYIAFADRHFNHSVGSKVEK